MIRHHLLVDNNGKHLNKNRRIPEQNFHTVRHQLTFTASKVNLEKGKRKMGEMETWKEMDALSREESIKRLHFL
jgi:hypothetical protein